METPKTLRDAMIWFADFEHCRQFMMQLRWPDGIVKCPLCGADKVTYLEKQRVWKCYAKHPRPTFSLKTGTLFEDSPIPLEKWLCAAWLIINCKNGISSYEIHRDLGITQKSAWFVLHRLRLAMKEKSLLKMGGDDGGPIEVDESYIGGEPKNKHRSKNPVQTVQPEYWFASKRRISAKSGPRDKVPVFGMLDRKTRQVRATVVPNVKREVLMDAILDNVEGKSTIYSDAAKQYRNLPALDFIHESVNHLQEYVRGEVHTNGLENFWSLLKRGLKGTYVSVEPYHLDAYVGEQICRYNNRRLSDAERFSLVMTQIVGRRLTYGELTGKTDKESAMRP